jgi:hypothetical protein
VDVRPVAPAAGRTANRAPVGRTSVAIKPQVATGSSSVYGGRKEASIAKPLLNDLVAFGLAVTPPLRSVPAGLNHVRQMESYQESKKDDYFAKMNSQIKKWDAEVDELRARSEQMGAEAREIRGAPRDHACRPRYRIREIGGTSGLQRIGVVTFGGWRGHGMGIDEERPGEGLATFKTTLRLEA